MSDIPLGRELLLDLADQLRDDKPDAAQTIEMIVSGLLYRQHTKPRSPIKSARMTSGIARSIRILNNARPTLSAQEIADMFGVNPGRVSEAIAGKW